MDSNLRAAWAIRFVRAQFLMFALAPVLFLLVVDVILGIPMLTHIYIGITGVCAVAALFFAWSWSARGVGFALIGTVVSVTGIYFIPWTPRHSFIRTTEIVDVGMDIDSVLRLMESVSVIDPSGGWLGEGEVLSIASRHLHMRLAAPALGANGVKTRLAFRSQLSTASDVFIVDFVNGHVIDTSFYYD